MNEILGYSIAGILGLMALTGWAYAFKTLFGIKRELKNRGL